MPKSIDNITLYKVLSPYLRDALSGIDPQVVRVEVACRDRDVEIDLVCYALDDQLVDFVFQGRRRLGQDMELLDGCVTLAAQSLPCVELALKFEGPLGKMIIQDLLRAFSKRSPQHVGR